MRLSFISVLLATLMCFSTSCAIAYMTEDENSEHHYPKNLLLRYADGTMIPRAQELTKMVDEVDFSQVESVNVKTVAGDITVISTDEPEVKIEVKGEFFRDDFFEWSLEDKVLTLRLNEDANKKIGGFFSFSFPINSSSIKLHMPEKDLEKIEITSVSGDIDIDLKKVLNVVLGSVSGDINIKLDARDLDLKTVSGDINIALETSEALFNARSTSGDVNVNILDKELNAEVVFKSVSGDFSYNGKTDESGEGYGSNNLKFGEGKGRLSIRTVSGDGSLKTAK
jgi:DUF4097 and DUF4098 domain-containing protein YvlB